MLNILLVDDEPHYLMLLGDFLRNQGWNVQTAENGEEALEKVRGQKFDLIISDIYMPVLNGIELQKSLKKLPEYAQTPFIYVSAYADSSTLATLELSETVKYISKSSSPVKMKEWITYLITPRESRGKNPGEESISTSESRRIVRDPNYHRRR